MSGAIRREPASFQQVPWDREELQKAAALWAEGHSASEIGRELKRSRNAVIGKIHRNRHLFARRETLPDQGFEDAWNRPWSQAEKMRAAAMARAGTAPSGIGVRLGRTGLAVTALMKREPGMFREEVAQVPGSPSHRADENIAGAASQGPQHHPKTTRGDDDCTLEGRAEVHGQAAGRPPENRTKGRGASLAPGVLAAAVGEASTPTRRSEASLRPLTSPQGGGEAADADPGVPPLGEAAFAPLPGTRPVPHLERTGCTWPVDPQGHYGPQLFCDAPVSAARRDSAKPCWCATHVRFERLRAGYAA
ncbi:GcrA family cell cycle regulator [Jiella marina]|uniref:GcrA family cell cycle regulator n=1 Tax=Jiella sp. LLJ827 TaxID=2917712 RepID=UPI0021010F85|nr:GcrA family cell cycle regulator [Jiella sp. LLJ827]MCQ0987528.1 hypothetical protein [Jiella sp. LLJ827]